MKFQRWFLFIIAILILPCNLEAKVRISEVMPINIETIDDENEFPESWLELYNEGEADELLLHYQIKISTESKEYSIKKDFILKAKSHTIFYGDEKKYFPHLSFKIPYKEKCTITLLSPKNEIVDEIVLPVPPKVGISFGIDSEDSTRRGWLSHSTPLEKNGRVCDTFLSPPLLSFNSPFFEGKTTLSLSIPEGSPEGSVIRYTTDGSQPSEESPISPQNIELTKTTVVKASTFAPNAIRSETITQTFISLGRDVTLPILSLSTDNKFLFDEEIGIYTDGKEDSTIKNYEEDWHRPVTIEYFDTIGSQKINQLGEMRVAGATSRVHPMKSLIVYANKRFGEKSFKHPFWNIKPQIKEVPSILLRNAGNDFLLAHLRDAASQTFFAQYVDDIDWQAYQPAILLINGEYFGITNIRERSNIDYIESNYQISNADVIENWIKVNSGSIKNYWDFVDLFSREDVTYEELEKVMDIDEFIHLLILEAYFGNIDFPDNNIVMWREQKENAKWRWIAKDLDMGWHYRFDRTPGADLFHMNFFSIYLAIDSTSSSWEDLEFPTRLMRCLAKKEKFKDKFIDLFTIYMGDFLNQKYIVKTLDSLANNIEYEFPYTFEKYADYRVNDYADWYEEIDIMRNFPQSRNILNLYALKDFYQLGEIFPLSIEKGGANQSKLIVNNIDLKTDEYNGHYFKERELKVVLNKHASDTLNMVGWRVDYYTEEEVESIYFAQDTLYLTVDSSMVFDHIKITPTDSIPIIPPKEPMFIHLSDGFTLKNYEIGKLVSIYDLTGRLLIKRIIDDAEETTIRIKQKGVILIKIGDTWHKHIL